MPSEQDRDSGELQIEIDTTEETESADDTQNTEDGEGESGSKLDLNADEEVDKLSPAEENAKRQEESWLNKVVSGKAELEDAPKWLHPRLTARLEAGAKVPETEEVVKKVMAQEREAQEFKALEKTIPRLNAVQAKELQDRFASLKPLGATKALKTAMDLMGLSGKVKEAEARGVAKGRMSIPQSGQPSVKKSDKVVGGVDLETIHDDKKWNEMIRKGQQS